MSNSYSLASFFAGVGGFPCQAFSIAGYQKGFEDERGNLFFDLLRIIKVKKPKVVFLENVKNLVSHDDGNTFNVIIKSLEANGYLVKWQVLNSKEYGNLPQNRERIYIVGFSNKEDYDRFVFPDKIKLVKTIHDVVNFDEQVDDKYYYSLDKHSFYDILKDNVKSSDTVYQWRRRYVRENKQGVFPTLTANMGTSGNNVPIILTNDNKIRKITPKEAFLVQGFPSDFKIPDNVSDSQLYKQASNSVAVPVVYRIAQNIISALEKSHD